MSHDEVLEYIQKPAVYGLVTYNLDGTVNKYSYISASEGEPHLFFLNEGWEFIPETGYLNEIGRIAVAYYDEKVVFYPRWS